MLTTDEIRALNEARDILDKLAADCAKHRRDSGDNYTLPDGFDYGTVNSRAYAAEWALFSVLNSLNSCRVQLIPDVLMHNREDDPLRSIGRGDVQVESEDDGFHVIVEGVTGRVMFTVGDGAGLLEAVKPVADHWAEGRAAAAEHQRQIDEQDETGYALDDPKHPTWHERVSDLSDRRKP